MSRNVLNSVGPVSHLAGSKRAVLAAALVAGLASTASAEYTAKGKISVPDGWKTTWTVEFTKDGTVIQSNTRSFTNNTGAAITKEWEQAGPADANDFETNSSTKQLATDTGATAAIVIPTQVPVTQDFLAANGFHSGNTFDVPLVVGDANHNGQLDITDTAVYSRMNNLFAFAGVADEANFPMHGLLSAGSGGLVGSLPGITFYTDLAMTNPISPGELLVTGVVSQSVPEPTGALACATAGLALIRRRRR